MNKLNSILTTAIDQKTAPFLVGMVGNADQVLWSGTAGELADSKLPSEKTLFKIFSMTKAIGATAAMILIDRGKLSLDTRVKDILPDFAKLQILTGFEEDNPQLQPADANATIRHLATHTSGLVYPTWHGDMAHLFRLNNSPLPNSGSKKMFELPLVFEPGERWAYGIGIDWLGQVVEAVDGRRIDHFCQTEIFDPLGMNDTVFELTSNQRDRLAQTYSRTQSGTFKSIDLPLPSKPEVYGMGHCLYSTPADYLTFLRCFLNNGTLNEQQILSRSAVKTMLQNHISPLTVGKMSSISPKQSADVDFFPGYKKSHSLGFLRIEENVPEMRAAGSQSWAGLLNSHYWFDPAQNIAAVFMTQMLPFADPAFMRSYQAFEQAVYRELV